MKKIIGLILYTISIISIIASLVNFLFIIIASGYGDMAISFIKFEIIFIIIAMMTYNIGKHLRQIN